MSSYGPINDKKDILILSKSPTQGLDDATLHTDYSITGQQQKKFVYVCIRMKVVVNYLLME